MNNRNLVIDAINLIYKRKIDTCISLLLEFESKDDGDSVKILNNLIFEMLREKKHFINRIYIIYSQTKL